MMLTEIEEDGCRRIMGKLSDADVISLAETITGRTIVVRSRHEAERNILFLSESAEDLLRRKKMKKDVLFEYAIECHIRVAQAAPKEHIITEILRHWGSSRSTGFHNNDTFDEDDSWTSGSQYRASAGAWPCSQNRSPTHGLDSSSTSGMNRSPTSGLNSSLTSVWNRSPTRGLNRPSTSGQNRSSTSGLSSARDSSAADQKIATIGATFLESQAAAVPNTSSWPAGAGTASSSAANPPSTFGIFIFNTATPPTPAERQTLAEAFAGWFYKMLNSQNPASSLPLMDFGPSHFWADAVMHLTTRMPEDLTDNTFQGSQSVCQKLLAMMQEDHLLFNPNLRWDGVRGRSNPHGLVVVEVCGTIHRNSECLGIFQQAFGLIRNPAQENNWKVKWLQLEVQSGQPTSTPSLGAPEQTSYLLN